MTDYTQPASVQRLLAAGERVGMRLSYAGSLPPGDTTWSLRLQTTTRRTSRPQEQSRGYAARVWAYLIELLLERSSPLRLGGDARLRPVDQQLFATKSVWPWGTVRGAFEYLLQRNYVSISVADGHYIATVNLDPLIDVLRAEHEIEREHPEAIGQYATLRLFRARALALMAAPPAWLTELLRRVDQEPKGLEP